MLTQNAIPIFISCVSWLKHGMCVQENILICFVFQEAMGVVVAVVGAEEALGVVTDTMDLVTVSVLFVLPSLPNVIDSCKSCLHFENKVCFGNSVSTL